VLQPVITALRDLAIKAPAVVVEELAKSLKDAWFQHGKDAYCLGYSASSGCPVGTMAVQHPLRRRLRVKYDDDPQDPADSISTIRVVTWHAKYRIGDEQPSKSPTEYIELLLDADTRNMPQEDIWNLFSDIAIWLPVYGYDHSGLTISCSPFSCPWDSGRLGFVYVLIADVLRENNASELTQKLRDDTLARLRSRVSYFDDYLTGRVYDVVLDETRNPYAELTDDVSWSNVYNVGGFSGSDSSVAADISHFMSIPEKVARTALDRIGTWVELP
jgi:hypothetical protein